MNFTFTFNNKPQSYRLYASGTEATANFFPKERRKFIAHQTVKHAACLLRINQIQIDFSRVFQSFFNSTFCNFMKNDSGIFFLIFFLKPKRFNQVPGNRFSFAVFIGCENDFISFPGKFHERFYFRLCFVRDNIFRGKIIFNINSHSVFWQIAHMAKRRFHLETFA